MSTTKTSVAAATSTVAANGEAQDVSLLDQIVAEGRFSKDAASQERGRDMIKEFVAQVLEGHMTVSRDAEATIQTRIAQIDQLISLQLNEILHHPSFQKLEGTWRGIRYLMDQSETNSMLKIKVLNVSKRELLKDLQRASEFDQSSLFKKVYEEEFGVFGGAPFAALIGDYEFGRGPEDIELLERVAQVASAAHAPFLSAASANLLNLEDFTQLGSPRDIGKIFDTTEYAKWKSFRQSEDSRYVGLTLPHVLMRLPYGKETKAVDDFDYEEAVDGTDHSKYLWGNAAYALGARLTNAFARYGWCAAIRGVEGGGLVEGLPAHTFRTDEGDVALKCPTEIAVTDRREKELADQGFIPLVHCKGTDYAAFFSVQSGNKPKLYDKDAANANARLSAQLPYILAMSRFAHYLKAIMRDKLGSFMSRDECEIFLNQWISHYVLSNDVATHAAKAKLPLREASIQVSEVPGKPGAYRAVAFLKPHFQLDELTISLRLVADLPESARS
ncbi:type VI secretion system contractile sheath large subunit [Granulicella mallensis]|uniref:Type VI secretion protein, EvpB/VC_A0108 family n=1 Tax=Granulicella mallensis (strain ATCC BAA-1857 / DSM 23137 / MP5ACTX8) TaxID=682795 RepID=G8NPU0_GRAMM|nr:type VI secretion system contractile sheath large subunit [Granulicella mallensis]AEU37179.1 type VI secretion protein, EvpB/VC_A0108 family [Granulicella mallensis MP5ACTX8]